MSGSIVLFGPASGAVGSGMIATVHIASGGYSGHSQDISGYVPQVASGSVTSGTPYPLALSSGAVISGYTREGSIRKSLERVFSPDAPAGIIADYLRDKGLDSDADYMLYVARGGR